MSLAPQVFALIVIGLGWGLTVPLTKIAVSTGYQPLGLIFWQAAIGAVVLGAILTLARRRFRPRPAQWVIAVVIAMTGTILPDLFSYRAAVHLPGGILAILLSLVPILSFPMAIALANDVFSWRKLAGLGLGLFAVLLIVGPDASLPDPALAIWVVVALVAPACYALEGNIVARFGTMGMDAVQTLCLASLIATALTGPLAVAEGAFIWPARFGAPELALILSATIHAFVYAGYVWLVGRAGPLFSVQVSYLVTTSGVIWSMVMLGERPAPLIWIALVVLLAGMTLVQPRAPRGQSDRLPEPPSAA
ncbi:DMT family transporter [Pseudooceanicola sp. MF1-13]|uniref:DMT family transporter n=1 Tax=Pseudooceanicola sp. MF1-13 TaxID=3379095 RepID=UPI0038922F19